MKFITLLHIALCSVVTVGAAHGDVLASFDDLPLPPAVDSSTGLQYTNTTNSLVYQGISWDSDFSVVGDQYRVNPLDGPLFGIPHSGHYFVTNTDGRSGLLITTDEVLTGAWFGRNEYYGFGSGADQISIFALSGQTELASVVFDLPEQNDGLPEPLSFVDTGIFAGLSNITGYRIDRRELGSQSGHWVADDFQFTTAVPLPGSLFSLLTGLAMLWVRSRNRR